MPGITPAFFRLVQGITKGVIYLHLKRIVHGDLQPANILLLDGGRGDAWILDLDRSRIEREGGLAEASRLRNLARLWRHVARREREYGPVLGARGVIRFLRAYGVGADSAGNLDLALGDQRPRDRRTQQIHAFVERVSAEHREHIIAAELVAQVLDEDVFRLNA